MRKAKRRQDVPPEIIHLEPEGAGEVIAGLVKLTEEVAGTCNFLLRRMNSLRDRGVKLIVDPAKGEDADAVREYEDIKQILTLMRDNIPKKVYDLVAINQMTNVSMREGKPN